MLIFILAKLSGVSVGVVDAVAVGVTVAVGVGDAVGVAVAVGVGDAVGVTVAVAVGTGVSVGLGVGEGFAVGIGLPFMVTGMPIESTYFPFFTFTTNSPFESAFTLFGATTS